MKKYILLGLGLLLCAYGWYRWELGPVRADDQTRVSVTIPHGASLHQTSVLLAKKGVIRSSWAFLFYAKFHGPGSVQAGDFFLQPAMSTPQVLDALRRGYSQEMSITIPEGLTLQDIDHLLAAKLLGKEGDLLACAKTCDFSSFDFLPKSGNFAARATRLEGYLYPDTYFVVRSAYDPKSFLQRLLTTFQDRVLQPLRSGVGASGHSLHQIITMASLVEEESRIESERATVAGILWKRLDQKISLGVDAAVRYIVGKPTAPLTAADLATDSPYNLRKFPGLPPGPIGNPGLSAINAALHPADSPYLYYLHDAEGQIHYAQTNDEQNQNRVRYLQ